MKFARITFPVEHFVVIVTFGLMALDAMVFFQSISKYQEKSKTIAVSHVILARVIISCYI